MTVLHSALLAAWLTWLQASFVSGKRRTGLEANAFGSQCCVGLVRVKEAGLLVEVKLWSSG